MLFDENGNKINESILKQQKIIFWGASTRNEKAIDNLQIQKQVLFFVDKDAEKHGESMGDYQIKSASELSNYQDCTIISVLTRNVKEIIKEVRKYGEMNCFFYVPIIFDIKVTTKNNQDIIGTLTNRKYIHIFPALVFIKAFYMMIEDEFDIDEHLFICDYNTRNEKFGVEQFIIDKNHKNRNILVLDGIHGFSDFIMSEMDCNAVFYSDKMKELVNVSDKIILHSAFWSKDAIEFISAFVGKMCNKMLWIPWGRDVEPYSLNMKNILDKVRCTFVPKKQIPAIKKYYSMPVKETLASYAYIPQSNSRKTGHRDDKIHILLGHSAAEYGNQKLGLTQLHKFCNCNIIIYCPLSYGSEEYAKEIIEMGKEMFKEKFVAITEVMDLERYYNFLNEIDVAVMPMQKRAAGTTLRYLNANGKKIFLNREMLDNYSDIGIRASAVQDISKMTFQQFVENENVFSTDLNEAVIEGWKKVFAE